MDWRALRFSALDGRGDCACHRFGAMPWKRFAKERFLPIRGGLPWLVYIGVFPDCGAMLRVGKGHPPFSQGVLPGKAQRNSLGKCAERGGVLRTNLFPLCPQVEHNGKAVFHFHAGKRVAGAGKHKLVDGRRVLRPPLQWRNASGRKRAKCAVECRAQAWPQPRPAVVSAAHRHWRRVRKPALSNALSERRFIKTGPEPYATTVRACFVDEFTPWQWP
ncbi:MAG TPA: hypothetical protein IAA52_10785 [Candidatus Pullichristensenella stercorigallinarum]|uniref:Uncharacterized protein n=1 Tax=Candidatus Pullichristensenella stercorigallinarum TaxID=2840909 RepID=A0A9D1CWY9_9FIRM|nr:hypothetical protein [Candidatus Pullichristensenella stercorigallinarum]